MLAIKFDDKEIEFVFNGIKVLNNSFTSLLAKNLLKNETNFYIEERHIKKSNIIYINEFTKLSDFLTLNRSSILIKKILNVLEDKKLVNNELLVNVVNEINKWIGIEYLSLNDGDEIKIINFLLEITKDIDLNQELFTFLIENDFWNEKMLFIFDNVSWLKTNKLLNYLNIHNFLIISNDFRNYIHSINELELVCIINNKYEYFDILDTEKLLDFLELKLNTKINKQNINDMLENKNDKLSNDLFFNILDIVNLNNKFN